MQSRIILRTTIMAIDSQNIVIVANFLKHEYCVTIV
jgi:hypothetical protein